MIVRAFESKVISFMKEQKMVRPGDLVTLGVSGGADSVCLLFLLYRTAADLGIRLQAVHVDHGIRAAAAEDAAFVQGLCEELEIPCTIVRKDVPALAGAWKCTVEDAGRRVRYEAFRAAGGDRIAVAHHLEDQAETQLLHLFRGSSLRGLGGMEPVSGKILRPLLCCSRQEIEAYLNALGRSWREDETNESNAYARNRLRHDVLTVAEDLFPGAAERMSRCAAELRETERFLEELLEQHLEGVVTGTPEEGWALDAGAFAALPSVLRGRLLRRLLESLTPGGRDISGTHISLLSAQCLTGGNGRLDLPFGIRSERSYGTVRIGRGDAAEAAAPPQYDLRQEVLEATSLSSEEMAELSLENFYTKAMDYAKIKQSPLLRTRKTGDYLYIRGADGELHRQSVKDYMINAKIPASCRDRLQLVADGAHCLWLIGFRMSDAVKLGQDTRQVLVLEAVPQA